MHDIALNKLYSSVLYNSVNMRHKSTITIRNLQESAYCKLIDDLDQFFKVIQAKFAKNTKNCSISVFHYIFSKYDALRKIFCENHSCITFPYMVMCFISLLICEVGPWLLLDTYRKVPTENYLMTLKNDLDSIIKVYSSKFATNT